MLAGLALACLWTGTPEALSQFSRSVIERGKEATVRVVSYDSEGELLGAGSGFFISDAGHVATNHHVVEGSGVLDVWFVAGSRVFVSPAQVVGTDPGNDLAILQTRRFPGAKVMTLALAEPSSGQKVMAIGYPGILDYVPAAGSGLTEVGDGEFRADRATMISFMPATFSGEVGRVLGNEAIAHSAKISGGNSGGALIDTSGRALGVNAAGLGTELGVDYAIAVRASHLVALARRHHVAVKISNSRASASGRSALLPGLLIVTVAALSAITFLMVLRRPREAVMRTVSGLAGEARRPSRRRSLPPERPVAPPPSRGGSGQMALRGRDNEGRSFHLAFDQDAFRRAGGKLFLGRNQELCQLHLPQDSVSRQHAVLILRDGAVHVEDRNSGNGTAVNGREISLGASPVALRPGDRLRVGEVELMFDHLS